MQTVVRNAVRQGSFMSREMEPFLHLPPDGARMAEKGQRGSDGGPVPHQHRASAPPTGRRMLEGSGHITPTCAGSYTETPQKWGAVSGRMLL